MQVWRLQGHYITYFDRASVTQHDTDTDPDNRETNWHSWWHKKRGTWVRINEYHLPLISWDVSWVASGPVQINVTKGQRTQHPHRKRQVTPLSLCQYHEGYVFLASVQTCFSMYYAARNLNANFFRESASNGSICTLIKLGFAFPEAYHCHISLCPLSSCDWWISRRSSYTFNTCLVCCFGVFGERILKFTPLNIQGRNKWQWLLKMDLIVRLFSWLQQQTSAPVRVHFATVYPDNRLVSLSIQTAHPQGDPFCAALTGATGKAQQIQL